MLDDNEIRHMAITLLTAPTARDAQRRVGASNLSNGCDFCLASNLMGDARETTITSRAWMGRTLGTATHSILEDRQAKVAAFIEQHPEAEAEIHVWIHIFEHYGAAGGTIDLLLLDQLIDWKGSTRKKSLVLQDFLRIIQGLEPYYGRTHKEIKLSEKVYAEEIAKQEYKVRGLMGQQNLYMRGLIASGRNVRRASLTFFNRDGTGWFDNPAADRYDDPKAVHDVWVMSFNYDEAFTLGLLARAQAIINHLQGGGKVDDFDRHPMCFPCGLDQQGALKEQAAVASLPQIDIEATFGQAAIAA